MLRFALVIVSILFLQACSYSPGEIKDALDNTDFATDRSPWLIVINPEKKAFELRRLNGEIVRTVASTEYFLVDVDARAERVLLRTKTGRYVASELDGTQRSLEEGSDWNFAAINGSGSRIALANKGKRLIRVRSFETLELLQETSCPEDSTCLLRGWDFTDDNVLWLQGRYDHFLRLNLATGESVIPIEDNPKLKHRVRNWRVGSHLCHETGASLVSNNIEIVLHEPGRKPRKLLVVEGARRGFSLIPGGHYLSPMGRPVFVADCRYVIVYFFGENWLIEVETGLIGRLPDRVRYALHRSSASR